MLIEFIETLEDVENHPVLPVLRGKFVKWDNTITRDELLAACPLTQVALKAAGNSFIYELQKAEYPSDCVVDFLKEYFDIDGERINYVWKEYDNHVSIPEIVASLELKLEAGDE